MVPGLWVFEFSRRQQRIRRNEPSLHAPVIPCTEVIESGLNIPFFEGELLPHVVARAVANPRRTDALTRKQLFTERQLEDAVTTSPHASERALFGFQRARHCHTLRTLIRKILTRLRENLLQMAFEKVRYILHMFSNSVVKLLLLAGGVFICFSRPIQ